MLKNVILVSNILGWNAKRTSLVQFHSVTPELAIISCQKYTQNPDTNAIFCISRQTRSPKSIGKKRLVTAEETSEKGSVKIMLFFADGEMASGRDLLLNIFFPSSPNDVKLLQYFFDLYRKVCGNFWADT